jgi:hypothetical protein
MNNEKLAPYFGDFYDSKDLWYSKEPTCGLNNEYVNIPTIPCQ